jgi:hypothetical protein
MMIDGLLDYLPADQIVAAFERSPGNEIGSGKFASPESSAALAANTFGYFLDRPSTLPPIPDAENCGWPALAVSIEECVPFPWHPRGRHPWLDGFIETDSHIIGVESKRYEPFRSKQAGEFSEAYWRPVWGTSMGKYEAVRDGLSNGLIVFERLDAVQLVKHAFGLRTEAVKRGKAVHLVYLFAEPETWANGKPVNIEYVKTHVSEVQRFREMVEGAEVSFSSCTYQYLLDAMNRSSETEVVNHAAAIQSTFNP